MAQMTRREFIAVSAASLIVTQSGESAVQDSESANPWYTTMRRCGQINYNERDPLTMDAEAWMDYWASLKVNAVLLNGGGIVAFYPTNVPYQHRSEFLGERDLFGDLAGAARKRGIRVVARMDCNYAYEEALLAHPGWFERNEDGSPRREPECPWLYKTCMFSTYFTEQMPAIYREINARYRPDGFFTNGWPSTGSLGVCYCPNCLKLYRERTGGVPPAHTDASSRVYRKYYELYMDRVAEIWRQWELAVREPNPDSVYVGNLGGGMSTVKDLKRFGEMAAWFNADHQGRNMNTPLWDCAQQGRVARSVMDGRTVTSVIGAYSTGHPVWRHASKSPAEATMWMAQTVASGMVPWYHWLGGSPLDNRWRETGREFYDWLAANEKHFRNRSSIAEVAVLYPQSTISFYRANGAPGRSLNGRRIEVTDYVQGLYESLLESRILFDMIHQENLSLQALKPYRALLIANAAYLRDAECEVIRQYVRGGGSLLATFETSRYNDWGELRGDFGLRDLFGVSVAGEVEGPHNNSYMHMDRAHPILKSFTGTEILPAPEFRVPVTHLASDSLFLSFVPPYPVFPPEMVFPRILHTQEPAAVFSKVGRGHVAYFQGDICRTSWTSGNTDLSRLLRESIGWLLSGSKAPLTVKGPGLIEVFAWETEPGFAIHILNYTNPNMSRPALRRFYPAGPFDVTFQVPPGRNVARACALRAGRAVPFRRNTSELTLRTPAVSDYQVIVLE
jgi:Hypothetical glycosyl hydrolase 6